MNINIKKLTADLRSGSKVLLTKTALTEDMQTIYNYYDEVERPSFMESYYKYYTKFNLIPFASIYFSKLIGLPINIVIKSDIAELSTSN